jgi:hypothetical protein
MIRRLFWLFLGVTLGAWAVLRAKKVIRSWAPRAIADHATELGTSLRGFADDVRVAMNAREIELRDTLGLNDSLDEHKDGH